MPYALELISLECNDTQEWFDEAVVGELLIIT